VLWRCWLGSRKGIRPVKTLGGLWGGGTVSAVGVAPTRTVGTSGSIIFPCSIKIQNTGGRETQHSPMLRQKAECFFWYRPTRVVPEQRPLNGCCSSSLCHLWSHVRSGSDHKATYVMLKCTHWQWIITCRHFCMTFCYLHTSYAGKAGIVFGGVSVCICMATQKLENYWSEIGVSW